MAWKWDVGVSKGIKQQGVGSAIHRDVEVINNINENKDRGKIVNQHGTFND